ncbi:hypothetical protein [Pedobacter africanus]|uniref:Uncharacterized protein n=1 Tax=Pedobacter africanus TaxID=151894 RepID=A0ACC6KVG3_9SPHI|nr:hypothetical protein [Pedobacter africanus]MDR6783324.1 hypothetical protein [Pedobacter africanus]
MERLCIYPKEAARLLNIGDRQAQRLFRNIRFALNKKKHQYITVKEFCEYTGIDERFIVL